MSVGGGARSFQRGRQHGKAEKSFGPGTDRRRDPDAAHALFSWPGLLRVAVVGALLWLLPMAG
jgi:chromate transporter